jgi:hypothetical protein
VAGVVAVALVCGVLLGCAPDKYMEDRARDLADCWDVGAGIGIPAYLRVKVTDLAVVAGGYAEGKTFGWRGRYGGPGGMSTEEDWAIPLVRTVEEAYTVDAGGVSHFCLEVETWGPSVTQRWYPEGEGRRLGTDFSDYCWLGAQLSAGVALRLGFNAVEFFDFLVGLSTLDPLQDDDAVPGAPPPPRR